MLVSHILWLLVVALNQSKPNILGGQLQGLVWIEKPGKLFMSRAMLDP